MVSSKKITKTRINFLALLSNTDASILKVKLDHNFMIEDMDSEDHTNLTSKFEGAHYSRSSAIRFVKEILFDLGCYNSQEDKSYCVINYFDIERKYIRARPPELLDFSHSMIDSYLKPKIQLMRLFKEGNICMPLQYFWYLKNDKPKLIARDRNLLFVSTESYTLEDSELEEINNYISTIELPFKENYLQIAFESFNLSYDTPIKELSFLSLMISLESLLNPSDNRELRYRISRNIAVLLGKDKKDSERIFSETKKFYDMRSKIVHRGGKDIISLEDILRLRYYVRESIKSFVKFGLKKNEIMVILNTLGFGEIRTVQI